MPRLPAFLRLADALLEGHLRDFLVAERSGGSSWDTIARELWARTDREVDVSGVTVQAWAKRLGIAENGSLVPTDAASTDEAVA